MDFNITKKGRKAGFRVLFSIDYSQLGFKIEEREIGKEIREVRGLIPLLLPDWGNFQEPGGVVDFERGTKVVFSILLLIKFLLLKKDWGLIFLLPIGPLICFLIWPFGTLSGILFPIYFFGLFFPIKNLLTLRKFLDWDFFH